MKFSNFRIIFKNEASIYKRKTQLEFNLNDLVVSVQGQYSPDEIMNDEDSYAYNRTRIFTRDISIVEKQFGGCVITTKVLEARLAVNIYDLIYKNHLSLADQKIQVLIPYVRITINHHLFLLIETLEIFSALVRDLSKEDIEKKANMRPVFIASDTQVNELRKELRNLKEDHLKNSNEPCRHCVLRYKKSKKITNIFIGDLSSVTGNLKQTNFADLYDFDLSSGLNRKNTGFSFTIQKMVQGVTSNSQDITSKISFLGVTEDIGVFKRNMMIHMSQSFPEETTLENLKSRESIRDSEHEAKNLLEIYPSLLADEDFLEHLEGNFWKYFHNHEKKYLMNDSEEISAHAFQSKEVSAISRFRRARVYILMINKQNILKELLKDFEIGRFSLEHEQNQLLIRIREISLNISQTKDLAGVLNVITILEYLNRWFCKFRKHYGSLSTQKMDQHLFIQEELGKMKSGQPIELDLKRILQSSLFSIYIQRVAFSVASGEILMVSLENFSFENSQHIPKESLGLVKFSEAKDVVPMMSIVAINFRIKEIASGSLVGLGLSYEPSKNCLTFYLRNFSYEASRRESCMQELSENPNFSKIDPFKGAKCRSSIQIPDLGVENNSLKKNPNYLIKEDIVAVTLQLVFHETDNLLEKVTVKCGRIGVVISSSDISEAITLIIELTGLYTGEKKQLIDELKSTFFLDQIFGEIDDMMKATQPGSSIKQPNDQVQGYTKPEPVAYEGFGLLLKVAVDGISFGFAKDDKVFLNVGVEGITATNQGMAKENMLVKLESISVTPSVGKIEDMVNSIAPGADAEFSVFVKNGKPIVRLRNMRVTFINRVIMEIICFQKEIKTRVKELTHIDDSESKSNHDQDDQDKDVPEIDLCTIEVSNCSLWIPRSSLNYEDSVQVFIAKAAIDITNKFDFIEFPGKLTPTNFKIGGPFEKAIIDFQRERDQHETPVKMFVVKSKINVEDVSVSYFMTHKVEKQIESKDIIGPGLVNKIVESEDYLIRDRCVRCLHANKIELEVTSPAKKNQINDWNLDANIVVKVSGITFNVNAGTIENEIVKIIESNIKEKSDVYEHKSTSLERVNLTVKGAASLFITKYLIKRKNRDSIKPPL